MYDVAAYGRMIADKARLAAHEEALRRSVVPGSVVVEVGAGTGIFSLLACQLGAARVYAIEANPAIAVARAGAKANGFEDRIVFLEQSSELVELPESADVLLSDLRGVLPLYGRHIPSIVDARSRFLKPGGIQIPRSDQLWVAPVHDPDTHQKLTEPWNAFGLDMSEAQTFAVNTMHSQRVGPSQLVAEPRQWAKLDYATILNANVGGSAEWVFGDNVRISGFGLWFAAELLDGISYTTAPNAPETTYGMAFLPLAVETKLETGDELRLRLRADLVGDSYVWTWNTELASGHDTQSFRQSTFFATLPPSPHALLQRSETFRPIAGQGAASDQLALDLMDGTRTLGEIAAALVERFPGDFASHSKALAHVADLSTRYASPTSD